MKRRRINTKEIRSAVVLCGNNNRPKTALNVKNEKRNNKISNSVYGRYVDEIRQRVTNFLNVRHSINKMLKRMIKKGHKPSFAVRTAYGSKSPFLDSKADDFEYNVQDENKRNGIFSSQNIGCIKEEKYGKQGFNFRRAKTAQKQRRQDINHAKKTINRYSIQDSEYINKPIFESSLLRPFCKAIPKKLKRPLSQSKPSQFPADSIDKQYSLDQRKKPSSPIFLSPPQNLSKSIGIRPATASANSSISLFKNSHAVKNKELIISRYSITKNPIKYEKTVSYTSPLKNWSHKRNVSCTEKRNLSPEEARNIYHNMAFLYELIKVELFH